MIRIYLLIVFMLSLHNAGAQDLKEALLKMRTAYEQTDRFHIVMQIKAFEDGQTTDPYYSEKADIRRSGNSYLYRFGGNDMLMNEKYLVMVDRNSKEIVCDKRSTKAEAETFRDLVKINFLDSILRLYDQPEYLGRDKDIDHYRIFQKKGAVNQIDLFININNSLLKRMDYHYRSKQYVTVVFEIFDIQPAFNSDTFDEEQYVTTVKGKMKVSEAFKNYTIIEAPAQ